MKRLSAWCGKFLDQQSGLGALRHETEFLPAALEIVETPPSPLGRIIMLSIAVFILIATLWACLGHLDIIATAEGHIIPTGKIKVIQPFETGVIKTIAVHDGQHVKSGDVLIELDPTIDQAEAGHVNHDLMAAEIDAAQLKALEYGSEMIVPDGASPTDVETSRHLLAAQRLELQSKLQSLDQQLQEKQAEAAGAQATVAKYKASLPMIEKRRDIRKYLSENEYGSKLTYLEAEQQLSEQEHELDVQRHKYDECEAAIASLHQQRAQADAEFHHTLLTRLSEDEGKIGSLREDAIKAGERTTLESLRSPVDGTVQQLAIHTIGGVVTPAEQLMIVVPEDAKLEIEATIANRDIGFVHAGQPAEVKVEAFTFTRYGLLHGKVIDISHDIAPLDERQNLQKSEKPTDDMADTKQPGYIARISLDQNSIDTETGPEALGPGMAVTAEIKTGRRRVIDYLISPLKRYTHEGMRER